MLEILPLVLEAAFRHDLQCGVAPLRLLDAALDDAAIEERQVAAAEMVGEVGGGEAEAGREELHRRGRKRAAGRSGGMPLTMPLPLEAFPGPQVLGEPHCFLSPNLR